MNRPPFEVADVIRIAGTRFRERYRASLNWPQIKVLDAIARCRTAALGGHRDQCMRCGHQAISYNSCRNRHCPKCQSNARDQWLDKRLQELLPVNYFHLVFSVPHTLVPLIWQNKKLLFRLLFQASAATLLNVASDPKRLGAQIGFLCILHTWGQTLQPHPHIHCVIPGGGLSSDHSRWISSRSSFFLPVKVLSRVFRGKFVAGLRRAFRQHQLRFYGECMPLAQEKNFTLFLRTLFQQDWVVYAKPPFGGPEHVLHYLARYTHRVAISNHRLLSVSDSTVSFRWKDYAHASQARIMTLSPEEFLRRFLQHVLPKGFPRIRYFGWLANHSRKDLLPLCRLLLHQPLPASRGSFPNRSTWQCPLCHGPMYVIERLSAAQIFLLETRSAFAYDTS
ncbi:MAG TPA: IS91 family transposase, partial [Candidatus Dormibacteraeota bacterium]|nr:IS91 family transposase [Candidatus Dormibacteraeota bacterium]